MRTHADDSFVAVLRVSAVARQSFRAWPLGLALVATLVAGSPTTGSARAATGLGTVTGQVRLVTRSSTRLPSAGAYPSRTISATASSDHPEMGNVIVFVDAPATPTTPRTATIRQIDEEFIPHVTAISTGSTVEFPNDDFVFHNVFSLSRASTFDLGRYPQGQSRLRTFKQAGAVKVYCHLHSHMSAVIRVFDHPHFVTPDADGRFRIDNVPAGRYAVAAWHERVGEVTLKAEVVAGRAVSLTFSLPLTAQP